MHSWQVQELSSYTSQPGLPVHSLQPPSVLAWPLSHSCRVGRAAFAGQVLGNSVLVRALCYMPQPSATALHLQATEHLRLPQHNAILAMGLAIALPLPLLTGAQRGVV